MWKSLIKTVTPVAKNKLCLLSAESSLQQQLRTTFILKRRVEPRLPKKGFPRKNLKTKNFLYDLVKDTNTERKPFIDVILTSYVDGLGNVGDKVSVHSLEAYDSLLLPGLAVYATPENVEKYKDFELKNVQHYSSSTVLGTMRRLQKITVSLVMNKDSPWTLQPWHVKASFRKFGFEVPDYAITLPDKPIKGPDMDIEAKEFYVTVTINKTEQVKVRCRIHHWSTDIKERLPHVEEFWKNRGELMFPEDAEIEQATTQNTVYLS